MAIYKSPTNNHDPKQGKHPLICQLEPSGSGYKLVALERWQEEGYSKSPHIRFSIIRFV